MTVHRHLTFELKFPVLREKACCTVPYQGRTIRTARLPGAGNLLCWAGEGLSDLPDGASHYSFSRLADLNSRDGCQVTEAVFVSQFQDSDIRFLSVIKPTDLTIAVCDWLIKTITGRR